MPEKMLFYDAGGHSVESVDDAATFVRLEFSAQGDLISETTGTVGDGNQPIMEPSALDRIPWLQHEATVHTQKKDTSRDYKEEYRLYQGKPHQIKERAARNKARSDMGLKVGDPREVDHKNPLSRGGSNSKRNLRVVERSTNRKKGDKDG